MTIDIERRKSVMGRSIRLGHCVCNPKLPCPCPIFKEHNVCQCAGERLPVKSGDIALTKHVRKAGCASKIGQADLLRVLSKLPKVEDENVLLGASAGDDAGVYKINEHTALVQTVDVFTPCVDDAYTFGQIAAANSLSDVYAMGGRPISALSIIGFPIDDLDDTIMEAMLRGGMDKMAEASCSVIGGHSINDEEIKFGYAVTGLVDPGAPIERANAQVGDALVLTKPLGTGMVSFAAQIGRVSDEGLAAIGDSMTRLNRDAAELMVAHDAHACTDVTGFALGGHLVEMVRGSGVSAEIDFRALPVFGAADGCLENEILSGAVERNADYAMAWIEVANDAGDEATIRRNRPILYDPQTSGGLLVSLAPDDADRYVEEMRARGHTATSVIGRVVERTTDDGKVIITNARLENIIGSRETITMADTNTKQPEACCANPPGATVSTPSSNADSTADALSYFMDFMKASNAPGLIDARNKRLMAIALSVAMKCKPCLVSHCRGALEMGITRDEIHEAANLAISFSGCTGMMLFKEICDELGL